jgi:prepilin-type N-terminal cleavage/methylation domain-containing protein
MSRRAGFTLIELSIALAIAVVLGGLVIVRVGGWSARQELHASARALGNAIRTWREKAELEERPFILVLDRENGRWRVEARGVLTRDKVAEGQLREGQGFGRVLAEKVELADPVSLVLDARGILPEIRIELLSGKEKVFVRLEPFLNEVAYEDPPAK